MTLRLTLNLSVYVAFLCLVLAAKFLRVEPLVTADHELLVVDVGGFESTEEDVVLLELVLLHLG